MNKKLGDRIKAAFGLAFAFALFILVSYIVQADLINLNIFSENILISIFLYILIFALEVVLLPINAYPLIPLASSIFGWIPAAIYGLIGWTIGSFMAFRIAQKYGKPALARIVSLKSVEKFEERIPKENLFWSVVLLRIFIPTDIVSYALGFFTKMKKRDYVLATFIGYAPLTFVLSYLGSIPFIYQVIGFIIGGILMLIGGWIILRKPKNERRRD